MTWRPEWKLQENQVLEEQAARSRLDYCLQGSLNFRTRWRRYVWTLPAIDLLFPITRFAGKRVLEIGVGKGRMSCLFAASGAAVTGVEIDDLREARREIDRWGLFDRISLETIGHDYQKIPAGPFDVVFTKSVLGFSDTRRYDKLLACIRDRLAPSGAALFLENVSNPFLYWLRRNITYRNSLWNVHDFGLTAKRVHQIAETFDKVEIRRYYRLVWTIRAFMKT